MKETAIVPLSQIIKLMKAARINKQFSILQRNSHNKKINLEFLKKDVNYCKHIEIFNNILISLHKM